MPPEQARQERVGRRRRHQHVRGRGERGGQSRRAAVTVAIQQQGHHARRRKRRRPPRAAGGHGQTRRGGAGRCRRHRRRCHGDGCVAAAEEEQVRVWGERPTVAGPVSPTVTRGANGGATWQPGWCRDTQRQRVAAKAATGTGQRPTRRKSRRHRCTYLHDHPRAAGGDGNRGRPPRAFVAWTARLHQPVPAATPPLCTCGSCDLPPGRRERTGGALRAANGSESPCEVRAEARVAVGLGQHNAPADGMQQPSPCGLRRVVPRQRATKPFNSGASGDPPRDEPGRTRPPLATTRGGRRTTSEVLLAGWKWSRRSWWCSGGCCHAIFTGRATRQTTICARLSGPSWPDQDGGPGGTPAFGRRTTDEVALAGICSAHTHHWEGPTDASSAILPWPIEPSTNRSRPVMGLPPSLTPVTDRSCRLPKSRPERSGPQLSRWRVACGASEEALHRVPPQASWRHIALGQAMGRHKLGATNSDCVPDRGSAKAGGTAIGIIVTLWGLWGDSPSTGILRLTALYWGIWTFQSKWCLFVPRGVLYTKLDAALSSP